MSRREWVDTTQAELHPGDLCRIRRPLATPGVEGEASSDFVLSCDLLVMRGRCQMNEVRCACVYVCGLSLCVCACV